MKNEDQETLKGREFGLWEVVGKLTRKKLKYGSQRAWPCRCKCEAKTERLVLESNLVSGKSTNCGCVRRQRLVDTLTTHGMSDRPEFNIWKGMLARCKNPNSEQYHDYGGRGIAVCDRWQGDQGFENFFADMGPRPEGNYTIERKDVNGNYCPNNCIWLPRPLQAFNKRNSRWVEYNGERKPLIVWAKEYGIPSEALAYRLDTGMPFDEAVSSPLQTRRKALVYKGEEKKAAELSKIAGVPANIIYRRIDKKGWSVEEAVETPVDPSEIGRPCPKMKHEIGGQLKSLREWAELYGLRYTTVKGRMTRGGMGLMEALTSPVESPSKPQKLPPYRGQQLKLADLVRIAGVSRKTIQKRLRDGWSVEDAAETPVGEKPPSRRTGATADITPPT